MFTTYCIFPSKSFFYPVPDLDPALSSFFFSNRKGKITVLDWFLLSLFPVQYSKA